MHSMLRMKRAYDPPSKEDGIRVLVERLWPRGVGKEKAAIDHWCKDVAPSADLRKWYAHDVAKWEEFRRRYLEELEGNPSVGRLKKLTDKGPVTLIFAARDSERSSAKVLLDLLQGSA